MNSHNQAGSGRTFTAADVFDIWRRRSLATALTVRLYREQAGVISPNPTWVCVGNDRMFTADTLEELIETIYTQWDDERHLVG